MKDGLRDIWDRIGERPHVVAIIELLTHKIDKVPNGIKASNELSSNHLLVPAILNSVKLLYDSFIFTYL
jgi:hypothetical protein